MALALLKRFDSSIEASLARSFLENEGIISFLFDGQEPVDRCSSRLDTDAADGR
jgi:hypothetical protein